LVQLHEYTRRTYQEENLDFLISVRMLVSVLKHTRRVAPVFNLTSLLDRNATSLPHVSACQLFELAQPPAVAALRDIAELNTPSDNVDEVPLGIAVTVNSPPAVNSVLLDGSRAYRRPSPITANAVSPIGVVPVFGDDSFLPRLHAQMHICRAAAIDSNSSSAPDTMFVPRIGEVLWAAFEIYNRHVQAGSSLEINISDHHRAALRTALSNSCEQAGALVDQTQKLTTGARSVRQPPQCRRPSAPTLLNNGTALGMVMDSSDVTHVNGQDGSATTWPLSASSASLASPVGSPVPPSSPAPLLIPMASTGAFLPPSSYLSLSVLCSPCPSAWLLSLLRSLQDVASEVAELVSVNVLSTFRQSREGDEANRLLAMAERLEQCSPVQQVALLQFLGSIITTQHGRTAPISPAYQMSAGQATGAAGWKNSQFHLGLQQLHSLLHGMPFQKTELRKSHEGMH
jgi:hypothetical protein